VGGKTAGCGASGGGSFDEIVWSSAEHVRKLHSIALFEEKLGWTAACCLEKQAVLKKHQTVKSIFSFSSLYQWVTALVAQFVPFFCVNFSDLTSNSGFLICLS